MPVSDRCLCIIAARKGSKRLKNKNRRPLNGIPLYEYSLEAAKRAGCFSDILVTTDDEEIQTAVGRDASVDLDERDVSYATDAATMMDVLIYLAGKYGTRFSDAQSMCVLIPCNPLRTQRHLREAYAQFNDAGADSLVSVLEYPFPPTLSLEIDAKGWLHRDWSGAARKEEHPVRHYPNGAIIILKIEAFLRSRMFYMDRTLAYRMPWPDGLDIDSFDDFALAERLVEAGFPTAFSEPDP